MKVAIVMPVATQLGGAEMMLMHLLRANGRTIGVDYHLAFLEAGPMVDEARALGYPADVFHAGRLRQTRRYFDTIVALRRWLYKVRPDAVLSWMGQAHLYTGLAALRTGIPAVWFQHAMPDKHWINVLSTRLPAQAIFCSSRAVAGAQSDLRPRRKMSVVFPAVDVCRFSPDDLPPPAAARRILGLPQDRPILGVVARLQRHKGIHIFVEAAEMLAQRRPDVYFVIIGGPFPLEPGYDADLEELARSRGISDSFRFAGQQKDVPLWMQAMDGVILPSIAPEGFGMALIEAMALGKVVIGTRRGGPVEIVEDGVDGYLVTPGSADELAAAMERALARADDGRFAAPAHDKALCYSTDRLAHDLASSLKSVICRPE